MFRSRSTAPAVSLCCHGPDDPESGSRLMAQRQHEPEREPMFEKPLTPSDVGKLNRLVIPKQHALNYFPIINRGEIRRETSLNFEDELGRSWKFRYSYWNSSQSYVLTKGWSRFVREKRLDAGDLVFFERHVMDSDRFFIGWRRRAATDTVAVQPAAVAARGPQAGRSEENETAPAGESKRLRLFGVNVNYRPEDESESSTPDPPAASSPRQHQPN